MFKYVCVTQKGRQEGGEMRWVGVEEVRRGRQTWWKYIFLITVGEVNAAYIGEEVGWGFGGGLAGGAHSLTGSGDRRR